MPTLTSNKTKIFVSVTLLVVLIGGGFFVARLWAQRITGLRASLERFSYILNLIINEYVVEVDHDKLIKRAIEGMLEGLDPYSNYLESDEYSELKTKLEAQFGGIGIYIGTRDNYPAVISPIEGTPAYRAGLRAGDKIIKIEDKSTENMSIQEAMKLLRGVPGTKVNITCRREGVSEDLNFSIVRDTIKIKAVPYYGVVAEGIGYIRLADFSRVARTEVEQALDTLFNKYKVKKIIFDLRSNPGGYLQEGFEVSDLFLSTGKTVVIAQGRRAETRREYVATAEGRDGDFPVIVLVDRGSASASEIVAGALQDWERALILGDTTFGKGSVQTVHPIDEANAIKLTTAYWYTPSGRCINRPTKLKVAKDTTEQQLAKKYYSLGAKKRLLYGGGGVAPDIYLPYPKATEFETKLIQSGAFFDFAVKYVAYHEKIKSDFIATDDVLLEFKDYLKTKKLEFTDEQFQASKEYIRQ
ncbi:MAG: S41 family peptidase, partial [candidate division WOR-3 bacterium]|nr:S41 family peptidase [candidate division WOR-3 bacterium]